LTLSKYDTKRAAIAKAEWQSAARGLSQRKAWVGKMPLGGLHRDFSAETPELQFWPYRSLCAVV